MDLTLTVIPNRCCSARNSSLVRTAIFVKTEQQPISLNAGHMFVGARP